MTALSSMIIKLARYDELKYVLEEMENEIFEYGEMLVLVANDKFQLETSYDYSINRMHLHTHHNRYGIEKNFVYIYYKIYDVMCMHHKEAYIKVPIEVFEDLIDIYQKEERGHGYGVCAVEDAYFEKYKDKITSHIDERYCNE